MAARLDEQLWTFQEDSFVPHTLNPDEMADCPVGIGHDPDDVRDHHDCLINLTPVVPRIFSRFETTVEIVTQAPDALAHSRARYRFYQNRGYDVRHIDMRTRH
jgi:DNA polymerase-3 subunit chi